MSGETVRFGWVIQPAAMRADQNGSLQADNRRFLELARGKFDSVWFEDHFMDVGRYKHHARLEGWTHLAYLMAQYPALRFGTLVLGQSYRNPALVAKMAATLQVLSDGRLILGIGAGWHGPEYDAYGWQFPSPGTRVRQLDEYAQIVRQMTRESPVTFNGKYYAVREAHNEPLPAIPVPLMIGGSGEQGTLRTAARFGDWWNFGMRPVADFVHKREVLRRHCDDAGRDFSEITLTAFHFINLSGNPALSASAPNVHVIGGDADAVTRALEEYAAEGVRHFMLRFVDFPQTKGLEAFLGGVLPRFAHGGNP